LSNFDLNNGEHLFQPIEKLGLLVANRPPGGVYPIDDSKPCPPTMPRQHEAGILDPQELVWRGKATFSGLPIWRHSKLKIVAPLTTPLKPCPVPHEALVWGQDENDLTNMSRITAYVTTRTMHMSMDEQTEILGLCVEFTADSGISPRIIGLAMDPRTGKAWPKQFSRSLDIDCPGGERITEIWWSKYPVYWHMKVSCLPTNLHILRPVAALPTDLLTMCPHTTTDANQPRSRAQLVPQPSQHTMGDTPSTRRQPTCRTCDRVRSAECALPAPTRKGKPNTLFLHNRLVISRVLTSSPSPPPSY